MAVWPYNTARWQRLRKLKLATHTLCEACLAQGRIEPAVAVDHRVPISVEARRARLSADGFPGLDLLASLCASCHNSKSRAEQVGEDWLRKGCDERGYPLDHRHPWYGKR